MTDETAAPGGVDLTRPSAARVYDYYLGGAHNFAVDREMAERAIGLWPDLPQIMQANRAFLRRAVQFCVDAGIRQFLDLGSGIPTVGNVHEVAQNLAPDARIVYVDNDPVAAAYSENILRGNDRTAVVQADLRRPDQVLDHPAVRSLLDFDEPVAVMMVAVLHFVPDSDDPAGIIARYREVMAPGSYLVLSHASQDGQPGQADSHQDLYRRTATPMTMRSKSQVAALLEDFDVVEPGIVFFPQWRPLSPEDVDDNPERFTGLAAVGRKA
ncbi:SAM-dependent methyltransferase [Lentzea sp. DG1S-22]|uniref:SAM-dependent methyltransferase n=1 Tax=Lentzea sp. DG1S-22 TaxID=3108822 RepID=UPI002E7A8468|nr:SAM-dependent methyltransferase [Lentzea sp. DG1S-22]WVH81795.1 SAM-dependent methyltransferase [Lentzea sp. DG1S-22]